MKDRNQKQETKDLVSAALGTGKSPTPSHPQGLDHTGFLGDATAEAEARDLIEVYFAVETPEERDAVFDQLVALPVPLVSEFLQGMMQADEDVFLRVSAAAALAERGHADAQAFLEKQLNEPEELYLFEHAVEALVRIRGESFYERVLSLWRDSTRPIGERKAAMIALETIAPTRAIFDFTKFVSELKDINTLQEDLLENAMLAFVRHNCDAAQIELDALCGRVEASTLPEDEKDELVQFIKEGIALLEDSPQK